MDTLRVFLIYLKSIEQNLPLPKEHPYCSTCHCPLSSVWVSLFPRMWAKSWRHCHLWLGMALVIHQKRFSSFQFGNRMEWMPWGLMLALIATCPRGIFGGVQVTPIAIRLRICNSKKVWLWVRYLLINHWQKQSTCPTHTHTHTQHANCANQMANNFSADCSNWRPFFASFSFFFF